MVVRQFYSETSREILITGDNKEQSYPILHKISRYHWGELG